MARPLAVLCVLLAVVASPAAAVVPELDMEPRSAYIVHVAPAHAPLLSSPRVLKRAYSSFLRDHLPMQIFHPAPRVLYAYAHAATGFAAVMTERQAAHLASQPSVVLAVVPDEMRQLHTTLTPSFLRLSPSSGLLPAGKGGKDIVIGVIDTGVYPKDRASFAAGPTFPPPPPTFRGRCVSTPAFNATKYCNRKLVGAKFFFKGYEAAIGRPIDEKEESKSPLDTNGHGTHTASTAAGSPVPNASFFNYAKGTAVGMAPLAHIAAYKVCWKLGCFGADILAAFEEAIKDRVNVISISIGATGQAPSFFQDTTAIGAFRAVRNNILVSASAGNSGPGEFTAVNVAPWILTVGASTINRKFPANVVLGDGQTLVGTSLYAGTPLGPTKRLVYGGNVGSSFCEPGRLNAGLVAGKIVLCDAGVVGSAAKGAAVKLAGGAGAIISSPAAFGELVLSTPHIIPAVDVTFADAQKIKRYISTTASPAATIIFRGTVVGPMPSSPRMASFSSRGPNLRAQEILKPDVTAPGVDILAAWTGERSPSGLTTDPRRVQFNIISGTSMSCPHVSGVASLLRDVHLTWSPAAIKSALMTTAYNVDNAGGVIKDMATGAASTPFVRGAGHVDPNHAADPGLIYDAGVDDYVSFLCEIGYTPQQIAIFTNDGSVTDCSKKTKPVGDLNYPAFSAVFRTATDKVTQRRVLRNVGTNVGATTYTATVTSPAGVVVTVKPQKLVFTAAQKTQGYEIMFAASGPRVATKYSFGSIVWSDGVHRVTSPIAITWPASPLAAM